MKGCGEKRGENEEEERKEGMGYYRGRGELSEREKCFK